MKVLGISGSLRRDSHNAKLLRAAGDLLPPGVELELWEGLKSVPPYDADDDGGDRDWILVSLDAAIRDAEFDLHLGKLSAEDYGELRARLEAQALEAMAEMERGEDGESR